MRDGFKGLVASVFAAALILTGFAAPAAAESSVKRTFTPITKPVAQPVGLKASKLMLGPLVHRYVAAYESNAGGVPVPAGSTGLGAQVSVAKPTVATGDYFSLMEVAAAKHITTGGVSARNIIEAGWEVNPPHYGDSNPHFFVGSWKHGTFLGRNAAGGFVDVTGTPNAADSVLAHVGTRKHIGINYNSTTPTGGGWWVSYTTPGQPTQWVGYYPSTIWTNTGPASHPTLPVVTGFTDVNEVQWFGEVVEDSTGLGTTQMGDGSCGHTATLPLNEATDPTIFGDMRTYQGTSSSTISNPYEYSTDPTRWDELSLATSTYALGGDGFSC